MAGFGREEIMEMEEETNGPIRLRYLELGMGAGLLE